MLYRKKEVLFSYSDIASLYSYWLTNCSDEVTFTEYLLHVACPSWVLGPYGADLVPNFVLDFYKERFN